MILVIAPAAPTANAFTGTALTELERELRSSAIGLGKVAARLESGLLSDYNKADAAFNAAPSDAAWSARELAIKAIRDAERCTPAQLGEKIASFRYRAGAKAVAAQAERDRAYLSQQVGRILPRRQMKRAA